MIWSIFKKIVPEVKVSASDETQAQTQKIVDNLDHTDIPEEKEPELISVTVAPGKTICINRIYYTEGSKADVEVSDVERLKKIGFIL